MNCRIIAGMRTAGIVLGLTLSGWACSDEDDPGVEVSGVSVAESFTDGRDGHVYTCIQVGDQVWMAENLRYRLPLGALSGCYTYGEDYMTTSDVQIDREKYLALVNEAIADGRIADPPGVMFGPVVLIPMYIEMQMPIETIIMYMSAYPEIAALLQEFNDRLYTEAVMEEATAHYEAAAAGNDRHAEKYGYLYSYEGAMEAVPEGWRLPTDEDWKKLEARLGMKEEELDAWNRWRGQGTGTLLKKGKDGIGFDVLFAGCNAYTAPANMYYTREDVGAYFWSSTLMPETDSTQIGIIRSLTVYDEGIMRATTKLKGYRPVLYSVRCIRKEEDGGQGQN